ncbi:hypothetical protein GCM10027084_02490 [Pseudoxanthomonas sangjuensis]|uniref:outer membrane protein n=1 Tax=Pseudoxanthomonas sangjuensis TaxID=1503750 RepID=UPI001391D6D6|nr:outer membrane beta-barrel protein [Pseudoxanthomonas sangjuensis]
MFKFGRVALVAIALGGIAPLAQAQGGFFIGGQAGQVKLSDIGLEDESGDGKSLNLGYRWQAGQRVQVGIEVGAGRIDGIDDRYSYDVGFSDGLAHVEERYGLKADYAQIGANARFQFGADSRWFAIARLGYLGYDQELSGSYSVSGVYTDSGRYSESDSGGGAYFGAGIGVDLTPNVNLNLMVNGYAYSSLYYDEYEGEYYWDDVSTARSTTLGIEFRF